MGPAARALDGRDSVASCVESACEPARSGTAFRAVPSLLPRCRARSCSGGSSRTRNAPPSQRSRPPTCRTSSRPPSVSPWARQPGQLLGSAYRPARQHLRRNPGHPPRRPPGHRRHRKCRQAVTHQDRLRRRRGGRRWHRRRPVPLLPRAPDRDQPASASSFPVPSCLAAGAARARLASSGQAPAPNHPLGRRCRRGDTASYAIAWAFPPATLTQVRSAAALAPSTMVLPVCFWLRGASPAGASGWRPWPEESRRRCRSVLTPRAVPGRAGLADHHPLWSSRDRHQDGCGSGDGKGRDTTTAPSPVRAPAWMIRAVADRRGS